MKRTKKKKTHKTDDLIFLFFCEWYTYTEQIQERNNGRTDREKTKRFKTKSNFFIKKDIQLAEKLNSSLKL